MEAATVGFRHVQPSTWRFMVRALIWLSLGKLQLLGLGFRV